MVIQGNNVPALGKFLDDYDVQSDERIPSIGLIFAAQYRATQASDLLLQLKADVNIDAIKHLRPIHLAASNGPLGIVRRLVDRKASLDVPNRTGDTALF